MGPPSGTVTGAHRRTLLWQVLREGGRTTAIGIGIGLVLALGAGGSSRASCTELMPSNPSC